MYFIIVYRRSSHDSPPPPWFAALAAVVACSDVDHFLNYFHNHHNRDHNPAPLALVSPLLSFIDIGARSVASAAACIPALPSPTCFPTQNNEAKISTDEEDIFGDLDVTCAEGQGSGSAAQQPAATADAFFSGVVLLQLLPVSSAAAAAAVAAAEVDSNDGHHDMTPLVRDMLVAASSMKLAEELGFVTSLAGPAAHHLCLQIVTISHRISHLHSSRHV